VVEGASAEDSSAYLVIGEKYLEMREYKKAMSWFMLGAWKNHPQCMFMIGYFYENGIFVARNVEIAMDWYIKSVSRSHQQALFQMDKLCQNGSYSKLVSKSKYRICAVICLL
jgi:TPR repeat protein